MNDGRQIWRIRQKQNNRVSGDLQLITVISHLYRRACVSKALE